MGLGLRYSAADISAAAKMKVRQNNPKKCLTVTIKSQRIYQSLLSSDFQERIQLKSIKQIKK